jgi:phage terminase large subunit
VKFWRGKDTMQVAGLIVQEWKDTDEDERPSEILVDVIGLGAGVVDRLRELGLPVRGVNVGEAAAVNDRYMRLRDELWFRARDWLAGADVKLPPDDALIGELTGPKYKITSTGKIQVESKDDMKKRGLQSPDLADAFILTLAGGLDRVPDERMDRYRRSLSKKRAGSGWAY